MIRNASRPSGEPCLRNNMNKSQDNPPIRQNLHQAAPLREAVPRWAERLDQSRSRRAAIKSQRANIRALVLRQIPFEEA
ncbi:hypothetical protein Trydic_g8213 [Trypoxylus dichotomus]